MQKILRQVDQFEVILHCVAKPKLPVTVAIRQLRSANVSFEAHLYGYVEKGGSAASSVALGVSEHVVIKTLMMQDDRNRPMVVLMHGDRSVSTKKLARHLGCKEVRPCEPAVAERHSGYKVGGTSPFGTRKTMPIYLEKSIGNLERIYLNGGQRGFLISLSPVDLIRVLNPEIVEVAIS